MSDESQWRISILTRVVDCGWIVYVRCVLVWRVYGTRIAHINDAVHDIYRTMFRLIPFGCGRATVSHLYSFGACRTIGPVHDLLCIIMFYTENVLNTYETYDSDSIHTHTRARARTHLRRIRSTHTTANLREKQMLTTKQNEICAFFCFFFFLFSSTLSSSSSFSVLNSTVWRWFRKCKILCNYVIAVKTLTLYQHNMIFKRS